MNGTTRGDLTDPQGRFVVEGVPPGQHAVIFEFIGRGSARQTVEVGPGEQIELEVRLGVEALPIDRVVVSATRETQSLAETAASVGIVQSAEIRQTRPTHPSEIMGKIPGVWVNVTGGEGHMTAIRQPLTTVFASYGQGFRSPSEGQLFRQGVALNTIDLQPVEAENYEAGLRGAIGNRLRYEVSAYHMEKTNDIRTFRREDDVRETQNAGATLHRGVKVGFGVSLPASLTFQTAVSYASTPTKIGSPARPPTTAARRWRSHRERCATQRWQGHLQESGARGLSSSGCTSDRTG